VTPEPQQLFPADAPASLVDAAEIVRNDWAAFRRLETLADHWQRPAWPDGAQAFYWIIPLGMHADLRELASACQNALASAPALDLVPRELLHMTVQRIGAVGEISEQDLADISLAAERRMKNVEAINISVGPLAGSKGAVRFTVTPWTNIVNLRQKLIEATRDVLHNLVDRGWRPHVSIAYNGMSRPAAPLIDLISDLRSTPPARVSINEVQLVQLMRSGRVYRWNEISRIPFGDN
jgi:2'-5' RNA ligase